MPPIFIQKQQSPTASTSQDPVAIWNASAIGTDPDAGQIGIPLVTKLTATRNIMGPHVLCLVDAPGREEDGARHIAPATALAPSLP